ncbi:unnamed protein product [Prunus armeniaca]|uniref:Uncharacterized protein n=1 Tax=Prunus armeniaca TaxID=36596 RepID=A0A6J5YAT1_PRUAR|nr:unnamed protein product [Prunus armeniaca]
MAMKETADAEKALKHLNPDGKEDLCPKTKHHPKEPMKLNSIPSEDQSKAEPSQSSKPKPASVIPAKKRSVLRMMFDRIGQWFRPAQLLLEPLKPHQTPTRSSATTFTQALSPLP